MGLRREVMISWQGETRTLVPSFALLMRIEDEAGSLPGLLHDLSAGRPRISRVAKLLEICLTTVGFKVTAEALAADLFGEDAERVMMLAAELVAAIIPQPDEKKPEAAGKKARRVIATRA